MDAPSQFGFGYVPNPEGVESFKASIRARRPVALRDAAPRLMSAGQQGDLMPYLAYYEVEIKAPDGSVWKPKGIEPPYEAQTGNNCTGISTAHAVDLLQCMDAAQGMAVVHRTCVEATYAFGLAAAGMRGDNGCYGAAMAKALHETGALDYGRVGAPYLESHSRLVQFANNPASVVSKYGPQAKDFVADEIVQITTTAEARAWLANSGLLLLPSSVGFNRTWLPTVDPAPRNAQGIVAAQGRWPHQMLGVGAVDSDGVDTFVIAQSWGPNVPAGPQPFRLPSFCFRVTAADFQRILDDDDVWGVRKFRNFEPLSPQPLPSKWTNTDWWGD